METRTTHHKDFNHHSHHPSSSSPQNTVCVLAEHQPVNHQESERLDISEITEAIIVNTVKPKEQCAQTIISKVEDQHAQINITAPVLAFPKEDLPYIVDTDASDYGIGGVLSQCIEGTEHVIAYYSKSFNPAQQKYCTTR